MYQSNLVVFNVVNHAIRSQCDTNESGVFFISTDSDENADLVIDNGRIIGAHYNSNSGTQALSDIGNINKARYFFKSGTPESFHIESRYDLPPTPDILHDLGFQAVQDMPLSEETGRKQKILVIDDSRMVRKVINKILTNKNYEVVEAEDGEQGISSVASERPDFILLDIILPGIDGNEVLKRIKNEDFSKDIPVILLTSTESLIEQGSQANAILKKPFKPDELLQCINGIDDL